MKYQISYSANVANNDFWCPKIVVRRFLGCLLKKYCLYLSSKKYAKQNLNVESISYKRVVQEGLRL